MIYDCIIVGAGYAGLVAAALLGGAGVKTLVLEHMESAAKKLLITGNGECNIAPAHKISAIRDYVSSEPGELESFISGELLEELTLFWKKRGLFFTEKNGGYYPVSCQASAVRDILLTECENAGIGIEYGIGIRNIAFKGNTFILDTKQGEYRSKTLLLATGGKSYKKTGSDGSGYLYLDRLGHEIADLLPGLVPLLTDDPYIKAASGVRVKCMAKLLTGDGGVTEEKGILQITDFGVSGICIFNLSLRLNDNKKARLLLDLIPELSVEELNAEYERILREYPYKLRTNEKLFTGLLPEKLLRAVLARLYDENGPGDPSDFERADLIRRFINAAKNYEINITGTKDFESAQVTRGGVRLSGVDCLTMESKKTPGLFFAGEILDCAGRCGGYNLAFAFDTARKAAAGVKKCLG